MSKKKPTHHHAVIDATDPERAAVGLGEVMFKALCELMYKLDANQGEDAVALFLHCFMGRLAGFLAVRVEPEGAIKLMSATLAALQRQAPEMEREIAARKGRVH